MKVLYFLQSSALSKSMMHIPTKRVGSTGKFAPITNVTGRPSAIVGNCTNGRTARQPVGGMGVTATKKPTVSGPSRAAMLDRTNNLNKTSDIATGDKVS